jgi:hypothetical protein
MQKDSAHLQGELTIKTFRDGQLVRTLGPFRNKVVSSDGYGRNLLLRQMTGDTTYPIVINSVSLGDGTAAPADGNTGLANSLVSGIPLTSTAIVNNVLTIEVFASDATLPNDTYEEFGTFMTGRLFSRVLFSSPYTKATGEDSLFTYTLTFTG